MITDASKSTGELMSDILGNVSYLVRNEADLARAEIAESAKSATAALGVMAMALVLAIAGANLLAASLVSLAVRAGIDAQWATPAVGLGLLVLALIIFASAKSALHKVGFVPTRAARHVQRDAAAIKETFNEH